MSKPFELNLARWFHEQFPDLDPQPGDRYAGELPDQSVAQAICENILSESSSDISRLEVEYEGETEEIPTIEIAGTDVGIVLVRRQGDDVSELFEVSRSYATTLRNLVAEGRHSVSDTALLMLYESSVLIETLDTTHTIFAADGRLPLSDFQHRIRENISLASSPGEAVIEAVDEQLDFPSDPLDNLDPLQVFCRVYDAGIQEDSSRLPSLIPEIGTYLTEPAFGDDWFKKSQSVEDLRNQADQILKRNQEHAQRIADAMKVTKDTRSELEAHYSDDFIETVLSSSDWRTISRTDAVNGELSGSQSKGGKSGSSGSGSKSKGSARDPEFERIDTEFDRAHIYGANASATGDRSVVAALTDSEFTATVTYDLDITDEPVSFTDSTGTELDDKWEVDGESVKISISGLDTDVPHYYRLEVYIGHKVRSGTPQNRFDFALVPEWFFDSLGSGTFGVDVEEEALLVRNASSVELTPAGQGTESNPTVVDITSDRQIELSEPVLLKPDAPPKVAQLRCRVIESADTAVPVNIDFLSEVDEATQGEVQLPLFLAAMMSPEDWADSQKLHIDSSVVADLAAGELHSPTRGRLELPETDRTLLGLEQALVDDSTIAPRETDQVEVGTGVPQDDEIANISADLLDAYNELFSHFNDRETVPSTDPWDAPTQELVETVLDRYLNAISAIDSGKTTLKFDPYRHLGTIRSTSADVVWYSPFHPLMLAYGLRVSQWRDDLAAENLTDGFRFGRFRSLFNPVGMNPYRWSTTDGGQILSGHTMENNHLWASYAPVEGPGSETPDYIADVVSDKLQAFATAFPLLFQLHSEREININLINMGDLGPVIEGLYDFFEFVLEHPTLNLPQVNLQLYGGPTKGRTLERFFATESSESPLREQLSGRGNSDSIIEHLDQRVTYVRAGKEYVDPDQRPAHLTLFRGILDEQPGAVDAENFPKATRMDGLLPRDQIKVDSEANQIVSRSGAAFDPSDQTLLSRIGGVVNTLEASIRDSEFAPDRTLSKVVTTSSRASLPQIWEQSLWVLHVEPKVDLDFYIRSTAEAGNISDDTLMIHYSDQYDAASPGFDVITTTDKRDPYIEALRQVLADTPGLDAIDPESVLTRLVAIDGELALDIQQAEGRKTMELLGLVGGLAVSAEILASELPEYEWIPISLNEFARHDRQYRTDEEGLLQFFGEGKASDDLCFIGLPQDSQAGELQLQLWIVETKGGTASVSKGVEQIQGAREKLLQLFEPDNGYADTGVLRSEFGEVILRIARRLYHYGVIDEDRLARVTQHDSRLADGEYEIELLEDAQNRLGEVVRIQQDLHLPELSNKDGVRILKLPTDVLTLINSSDIGSNEIHPSLQIGDLAFETPGTGGRSEEDTEDAPASGTVDATSSDSGAESEDELSDSAEDEKTQSEVESGKETEPTDDTESPVAGDEVSDDTTSPETEPAEEGAQSGAGSTESTTEPEDETAEPDSQPSPSDESDEARADEALSTDDGFAWTEADIQQVISSLEESPDESLSVDVSKLTKNLKQQFESLGIDVYEPNPADVSIGPRKIGVNVRPKQGQKIGSVLNALDSVSVHIQASGTITGVSNPAEGAIRLEIPHGEPRDIHLRDGLEASRDQFSEPLRIPLGVTTENEHVTIDLLKEHHALIGGATGSGKSNFLATTISSLAINYSPDQVRLSLLDPKGIDFGRFESLPQVDTYLDDASECVDYLQQLLETELPDRKEKLQAKGASSVQEYNRLAETRDFDPIPYRVIVIDEFADLVMSLSDDKDEFEDAVGRLAQIGRALGYSILLATQRPDADIVSGSIKTNFNCRISFELPSNTDSRVILDQPGAEDLAGAGDMIALTSSGDEYHLQSYLLLPEDALRIREELE